MYFLSGNILFRDETGIPTALVNPLGFTTDDFDVVQAIYNQNNGTQSAGEQDQASSTDEPIVLGLRSGFQNVLDTIDITKFTSKTRQGMGFRGSSGIFAINVTGARKIDFFLRGYELRSYPNRYLFAQNL